MNKHYFVILGLSVLVLLLCIWRINRANRKQVEEETRQHEARMKAREERAYRHQRVHAMSKVDQEAYFAKQRDNLKARNDAMTNAVDNSGDLRSL